MSRQKMEDKWEEPRQVCHDKGFNVATKSSVLTIQGKTTLL